MIKEASKNPYIKSSEFNVLIKEIEKSFSSLDDKKSVLIHNDLRVKNFLTDGENITGIIDFENGYYGPLFRE
jgi:aminoglycoside phosphotransferase (APT) family kinase protein